MPGRINQVCGMAGVGQRPIGRIWSALVGVILAAVLLVLTTTVRSALTPHLGDLSPFMLYVAAVLVAGLIHGAFCGALVMLGGGVLGLTLFLAPGQQGSIIALMLFWGVSAPVLVTANELRVQLREAMARLSAALARHKSPPATPQ